MLTPRPALLLMALILAATTVAEEPMDVDLSDSLDFEAFHKEKEGAIKLWDDPQPDQTAAQQPEDGAADAATDDGSPDREDQRYEIRALYSINGSERTDLTPTTVVQALYAQMRDRCPEGWRKLDERSEPDGDDTYYMYYTFECL